MTTLTNLELESLRSCNDVSPLQRLPLLQRLALRHSGTLAAQLLKPDTFISLQELHSEDDYAIVDYHSEDEARNEAWAAAKVAAVECMSALLQLPCIRKISGNASLLAWGLPQSPEGWHVSNVDDDSRVFTKL